jgi:hypothetical protein
MGKIVQVIDDKTGEIIDAYEIPEHADETDENDAPAEQFSENEREITGLLMAQLALNWMPQKQIGRETVIYMV